MIHYLWEDFNHPNVVRLKDEYKLDRIVIHDKSEFEQQILLRTWLYNTLPLGNPERDYSTLSAFEILDDAKKDKKFYCTWMTLAYIQCGIALGWYTRKIGADYDHLQGEEEKHHGICDIWSNQYQKWYVVDPMHNLHYEKYGVPLNALEIRNEYLENECRNIKGIIGNKEKVISYTKEDKGFNTPSNFYWFFIGLRNNFFEKPNIWDTKALLWIDEYNKDKFWYKGGGKHGESHKHPMYESQFIMSSDVNLFFPIMS